MNTSYYPGLSKYLIDVGSIQFSYSNLASVRVYERSIESKTQPVTKVCDHYHFLFQRLYLFESQGFSRYRSCRNNTQLICISFVQNRKETLSCFLLYQNVTSFPQNLRSLYQCESDFDCFHHELQRDISYYHRKN